MMRRRELVKLVRETKQNNRKFVLLVLLLFDLFSKIICFVSQKFIKTSFILCCFSQVYKDKFQIVWYNYKKRETYHTKHTNNLLQNTKTYYIVFFCHMVSLLSSSAIKQRELHQSCIIQSSPRQ